MLVVDASAALYLAASSAGFSSLAEHDPIAPPLMWSEATSAVRESLFRGSLSEDSADAMLARLAGSTIRLERPTALYSTAFSIARQLGWAKTYDAEYVALASLSSCRLLTADRRLQRGAGHLVTIIDPTEI